MWLSLMEKHARCLPLDPPLSLLDAFSALYGVGIVRLGDFALSLPLSMPPPWRRGAPSIPHNWEPLRLLNVRGSSTVCEQM